MKKQFCHLLLAFLCVLPMLSLNLWAADEPQPQASPFAFGDLSIPAEKPITRAQVAALAVRTLDAQQQADLSDYTDVPADAWYRQQMAQAVAAGLFEGYNSQLRPEDPITRQEAGLVLSRLLCTGETEGALADLAESQPREPLSRGEFLKLSNGLLSQTLDPGCQGWQLEGSTLIAQPGDYSRLTVEGDLILSEGAQSGQITLRDALVSGRILIRGGGQVRLEGRVQAGQITVAPSSSRLRLDCQTEQPQAVHILGSLTHLSGNYTSISLCSPEGQTMLAGSAQTVSLLAENSCFQALPGSQVGLAEIRQPGCLLLGQGSIRQAAVASVNAQIDTPDTQILFLSGSGPVWRDGALLQPGSTQSVAAKKRETAASQTPFFWPSSPSKPSEPSQPEQPERPPEQPPEQPISPPPVDSVRLDSDRSDANLRGLKQEIQQDTLVLSLELEQPFSGKLPDALEDYFQGKQPQGPFSGVALVFQAPPDLQDQPVTLAYTSQVMLEMGYGPADNTDSITYQVQNGVLQVEQRFTAGQAAQGMPLILPFRGQEQVAIQLRWGDQERRYRL